MNKRTFLNAGAAVFFSVGLSVSAFSQESTPTPTPSPVESPSPTEAPSPSPMPSPMESPSPSPMMPSPSPTPETVPAAVEKPKTAEAVTTVSNKEATTSTVASTYDVPLLNVPSFSSKTTEIKVKFAGELEGLKGKAYITRQKDGVSQIKMRFDDMKMAPKQKRYVLWAVAPDKSYTKIGQVINTGEKQEAEVRGETNLSDFGLFITQEEEEVTAPAGTTYAPFGVGKL